MSSVGVVEQTPQPEQLPATLEELAPVVDQVAGAWRVAVNAPQDPNHSFYAHFAPEQRTTRFSFWMNVREYRALTMTFNAERGGWDVIQDSCSPAHEVGQSDLVLRTRQVFPLTPGAKGAVTKTLGDYATVNNGPEKVIFAPLSGRGNIEERPTEPLTAESCGALSADLARVQELFTAKPAQARWERIRVAFRSLWTVFAERPSEGR